MAFEEASQNISLIAGEAMTISRFVDVQTDGTVDMADAPANIAMGISAETVATGIVVPVAISGVGMLELGATIAAGVMCSAGANGVGAAASTTTNEVVCGPLLEGGDSGDIVAILISFRTIAPA
jgi:hypothetical protein